MMHLDTSFLVDLLREHARRQSGRATSFLEENAREHLRVGAMDLLIATAALVDAAPVVTNNLDDFSRVPGLEVVRH